MLKTIGIQSNQMWGMPMNIDAKIGTGPHKVIRVGWKRKLPEVGDRIKFKSLPVKHGEEWKHGYVYDIRNVKMFDLYFISL